MLRDVSFVDDTACPVSGNAAEIVAKTAAVAAAAAAVSVFKCFNLDLNFSAGKSEGVLSLTGRGKKLAMRAVVKAGNCIHFPGTNGTVLCLRFVKNYKHVGTKVTFDSCIGEEVGTRCSIMRGTFRSLRKKFFNNPRIPVQRRLFILQVYVLTKGIFQAGSWPVLPEKVMGKFNTCIMYMYRVIIGYCKGGVTRDSISPIVISLIITRLCVL
jgi:hypothetical protein